VFKKLAFTFTFTFLSKFPDVIWSPLLFYSKGLRGSFHGNKYAGVCDTEFSALPNTVVKNAWSHVFTPHILSWPPKQQHFITVSSLHNFDVVTYVADVSYFILRDPCAREIQKC
jgi:hypothetical protein